jgi:hypothetical protein
MSFSNFPAFQFAINPLKVMLLLFASILMTLVACKKEEIPQDDTRPVVSTVGIIPITPTKVTLKGSLTGNGKIKVLDFGFVYDVRGSFNGPTKKTVSLGSEAKNGEFTAVIEGLNPGFYQNDREYIYAMAYYTNEYGTIYGERIQVAMPQLNTQNVTPRQGKIGDRITLDGDFFTSGTKELKVYFSKVEAKVISASDKQIVVEVPSGIPLSHGQLLDIDVSIDGQLSSASGGFVIQATFSDFSPKSGPVNTVIHFTGENLPLGLSNIEVTFGGLNSFAFFNDQFLAWAPDSKQIKTKVAVKVNGITTALPGEFTYTPPVITSISPLAAFPVEIISFKGTNFPLFTSSHYATVMVGTLRTSASLDGEEITASIPAQLEPGTYPVTFITGPFTVVAPQQLTIKPYQMISLSPTTGFPLTKITIKGTFNRFQDYFVHFGDRKVLGKAISNDEVVVTAPLGNNGDILKLEVEMVGGQKIPVPGVFVMKGPLITSFSPSSGGAGTQVELKGANFRPEFGGFIDLVTGSAPFDEVTENTIKFTIPNVVGTGTNKLKAVINSQTAVSSSNFTVTN